MSKLEEFVSKVLSQYRVPKDQKESAYGRLTFVISQLNKKGIKCHYDPPTSDESRVLLYSNRFNADNYELARECNGLIMDYSDKKSWPVVCRPPDLANARWDPIAVEKNMDEYDVYCARDGTVINLYYYNGKWCISTARGLDMGPLDWCGINYQKCWDSMCKKYALDVKQFDVSTTYTFGFSHPKIHIYNGVEEMWFISAKKTDGARVWRSPFDVKDSKENLPNQELAPKMTYEKMMVALESNDNYGFILRSNDVKKTGFNSTLYLESALMKKIRTHLYDRGLVDTAPEKYDRMKHLVLYSWLAGDARSKEFVTMFPRFAADHERFDTELQELHVGICHQKNDTQLCKYFKTEIMKYRTLSEMSDLEIMAFARSKDYAEPWYQHLWPEKPQ